MNKRLAELLADIFGLRISEIHSGLHKDEVGSWDSLKQMDLVVTLEKEYDIELGIPEILSMTSVGEIEAVLVDKGVELGR